MNTQQDSEAPYGWASEWFALHHCKECKKCLTSKERFDTNGCCPYCGALSSSTIVDTIPLSVRFRYIEPPHPWYMFWKDRKKTIVLRKK